MTGDITVTANFAIASGYYTIGGTISDLSGTLVLQNNNSDDLTVSADGSFTFPTPKHRALNTLSLSRPSLPASSAL